MIVSGRGRVDRTSGDPNASSIVEADSFRSDQTLNNRWFFSMSSSECAKSLSFFTRSAPEPNHEKCQPASATLGMGRPWSLRRAEKLVGRSPQRKATLWSHMTVWPSR